MTIHGHIKLLLMSVLRDKQAAGDGGCAHTRRAAAHARISYAAQCYSVPRCARATAQVRGTRTQGG